MADLELLLEAERRGLLPDDKKALLAEARSRGLVPGDSSTQDASRAGQFPMSAATPQEPDTSFTQNLGVANKALGPYAAAAATGAALGAPVGGVGAIPGAGMGVLALGAGDLGTSLYNAATPLWGGQRVHTPSETIRNAMVSGGVARDPQTDAQNMLYQGLNGAGSGLSSAAGFNALRGMATGTAGKVFGQLAENPGNQAVAGAGGTMLPTALQQAGVDNPYVLAGSSLAGNVLGGAAGSKVLPMIANGMDRAGTALNNGVAKMTGQPYEDVAGPLTMDQLKARAQASFKAADESGAIYDPQKFGDFVKDLRVKLKENDYYPDNNTHSPITALLDRAGEATTEAQKLSWMHDFRQAIGRARAGSDKDVRRMAGIMGDELDGFISDPNNAINATKSNISGRMYAGPADTPVGAESQSNVTEGSKALMSGIEDWRKLSRAQEIETAIDRAKINASSNDKDFADTVRQQFASIARNDSRMKKFSPDERKAISDLVEGNSSSSVTRALSFLAPDFKGPGVATTMAKLMGTVELGSQLGGHGLTGTLAAPIVAGTAGYGANALRNHNAMNAATALSQNVRNGFVPQQTPYNFTPSLNIYPPGYSQ